MDSPVNLPAVFIANIMGLVIFFCVIISRLSAFKLSSKHSKPLITMLIASCISCIADPLCFWADGKPGLLPYILVFGCNTWLYLGNITVAISWIYLIANRLNVKLSKAHRIVLSSVGASVCAAMVINFFIPIVFSVSERNVYARSSMNWVIYVTNLLLLSDGIILYYRARAKSGRIKFFPIWAFMLPALIGTGIQGFMYGVSTIVPFTMIALGCMISCLQNEMLFTDKLTGLYNRYILDVLQSQVAKEKSKFSIMLLDIDQFKSINDTYGHNVGDKALIELSTILKSVVKNGEVLRYAGDEFIVVVYMQEENKVQEVVSQIHQALRDFNQTSGNPYELSVSLGYGKLDLTKHTMDEILDIIDKQMYKNKQAYYRNEGNGSHA